MPAIFLDFHTGQHVRHLSLDGARFENFFACRRDPDRVLPFFESVFVRGLLRRPYHSRGHPD